MRYAISVLCPSGSDLYYMGVSNYVGGDRDLRSDVQQIALPYFKDESDEDLAERCLQNVKRIWMASKLQHKRLACISVELIHGNTGFKLSKAFLEDLGELCGRLKISIILDETLTFARCVPF